MNEDLKMTESIRDAINACTKRVDYAPSLSYRVLRKAKGEEEPVIKKASMTLVIVLIILALTAVAVAATVLWNWKDVGEKAAEMEGEYGYYEDWDTATKIKLVRDLYDMEALKGNEDAERLLSSEGMTDAEKDALCDRIMLDFIGQDGDRVDLICLETIMSTLGDVEGGTLAWSVEDKYWYNQLMEKYGIPTGETNYVLPEEGEINQEEAVRIARTLLESKSDWNLDDGVMSPSLEENIPGRRIWTIWYVLRIDGEYNGTSCLVTLKPDGTVLSYDLPELYALELTGLIPDDSAIPEEQALETGRKAIAEKLGVPEDELNGIKTYYAEIEPGYSKAVDGIMGEHVWLVDCPEKNMFAVLKPDGTVKNVREH